ncbi:helix-hairpin-helix domain-containing protein [Vibrio barjaei]|uniref:helix-hairpin-helix domain-containing protein n=1 Tax=Vibrio barjaei TaxID=1676683 RepID=UPI0022837B03|nr:helix-hairpin-helix domain-containing protein [Vibrio barjaei]MCY9874502.1 hypothetical protein [Vibrio barjaei]
MYLRGYIHQASGVVKYYVNGAEFRGRPYITLLDGRVVLHDATEFERSRLQIEFPELFKFEGSALEIDVLLEKCGYLMEKGKRTPVIQNLHEQEEALDKMYKLSGAHDYIVASHRLDINNCSFRATRLSSMYAQVSHGLEKEWRDMFEVTPLKVLDISSDSLGDIVLGDHVSQRELIVKIVSVGQLRASIKDLSFKEQSENLWRYQVKEMWAGRDVKVVWIVLSELNGAGLYSCADTIEETTSIVSYLTGCLGHHVVECYSRQHAVLQIQKMTQMHVDKAVIDTSLPGNNKKSAKAFEREIFDTPFTNKDIHAMTDPARRLEAILLNMPNINQRTAKSLAKTGKSLAELANLTPDELGQLDGVGVGSAELIYRTFNTNAEGRL